MIPEGSNLWQEKYKNATYDPSRVALYMYSPLALCFFQQMLSFCATPLESLFEFRCVFCHSWTSPKSGMLYNDPSGIKLWQEKNNSATYDPSGVALYSLTLTSPPPYPRSLSSLPRRKDVSVHFWQI